MFRINTLWTFRICTEMLYVFQHFVPEIYWHTSTYKQTYPSPRSLSAKCLLNGWIILYWFAKNGQFITPCQQPYGTGTTVWSTGPIYFTTCQHLAPNHKNQYYKKRHVSNTATNHRTMETHPDSVLSHTNTSYLVYELNHWTMYNITLVITGRTFYLDIKVVNWNESSSPSSPQAQSTKVRMTYLKQKRKKTEYNKFHNCENQNIFFTIKRFSRSAGWYSLHSHPHMSLSPGNVQIKMCQLTAHAGVMVTL
jgi:hypothetical protein